LTLLLLSDSTHSLFASMRMFASYRGKAMKAWWRGALIQRRGLSRLPADGNGERAKLRLSPKGQGPRVFSGIQPTGIPHLGNYLGALRPWVELQNGRIDHHRCLFCVVDLHALTIPQDAEHLAQWRKESFASLLAVGLDPQKSVIFMQSDVSLPSTRLKRR
jgi:tryptophanyl-tRNA synthetase